MFGVPTRENDGMSFLIDKVELERKWKDCGQGQIVGFYPLVFREDLDEVGNFGTRTFVDDDDDQFEIPVSEGFVDWYRYGDHDHSGEWITKNTRSHDLIKFYDDENDEGGDEQMQSRTVDAYLGKHLPTTLGSLPEVSELFEDARESDSYADKTAMWKLGLYWTTDRRFWFISRDIEKVIERLGHL